MKKFLNRLFSSIFGGKRNKMLSKTELDSFESHFKMVQRRLKEESEKTENKELIRAYERLNDLMEPALKAISNISEVQSEIDDNDRMKNFEDFNK